jgi:hypothetical protein
MSVRSAPRRPRPRSQPTGLGFPRISAPGAIRPTKRGRLKERNAAELDRGNAHQGGAYEDQKAGCGGHCRGGRSAPVQLQRGGCRHKSSSGARPVAPPGAWADGARRRTGCRQVWSGWEGHRARRGAGDLLGSGTRPRASSGAAERDSRASKPVLSGAASPGRRPAGPSRPRRCPRWPASPWSLGGRRPAAR